MGQRFWDSRESGRPPPPLVYKMWVPKGLVKEGKLPTGKISPVEANSENTFPIKWLIARLKRDIFQIKAVTSCSTHKIDQQETDG